MIISIIEKQRREDTITDITLPATDDSDDQRNSQG